MASFIKRFLLVLGAITVVRSHMSIWHPSMYAFNGTTDCVGEDCKHDQVNPITPNSEFKDWWMRGETTINAPPNTVLNMRAGGKVTFEIACDKEWTSYGHHYYTSRPGLANQDACPTDAGAYHADPAAKIVNTTLIKGCALGIADTNDIRKVGMNDITIFTVQKNCVWNKTTDFYIPPKMPKCSKGKCICTWFWLAETGTPNFYMTPFDCNVVGSPRDARPLAKPKPPVYCGGRKTPCTRGAKQPLYIFNKPTNYNGPLPNENRVSYQPAWGFNDGPQNDIFK